MIQQILTLGSIVIFLASCRPGGERIDKSTRDELVYQPGSKISFDSDNPDEDPPLFTADASLICSDLSFYNRDGLLVQGTRVCSGSLPSCGDQTQTACVATDTHPAVSKTELEAKVMAGESIAGISGTAVIAGYQACSTDGATACLTNTAFKAADISLVTPANLKTGVTIAGQTGAFPSASYPLSGATTTADLTNFITQLKSDDSFEFWDSSGQRYTGSGDSDILAANVKEGVSFENLSITGILPTTPVVTPTNLSGTYTTGPDRVELSWDDMSTTGYLLIARDGAAVNWTPANGQSYSTGSQGANEILYVGALQTATHSGITAGNSYHYALYAYNANYYYSATPITLSLGAIDCSSLAGGTWVAVPGDTDYSTNAFCVMKYEAKDVGGVATSQASGSPWASINQTDSITECSNLGGDYHLITNNEWMTIAANIANVADNWSGGSVGSGSLNRGHSDGSSGALAADADDNNACSGTGETCDASTWDLQRRTFKLSTGEAIWDLGGNVVEWTSYYEPSGKATPATTAWTEYPSVGDGATTTKAMLVPTYAAKSWWNDSWNSTQGIGQYYAGSNGSGGALRRGGAMGGNALVGVFAAMLEREPSGPFGGAFGFRCASAAP